MIGPFVSSSGRWPSIHNIRGNVANRKPKPKVSIDPEPVNESTQTSNSNNPPNEDPNTGSRVPAINFDELRATNNHGEPGTKKLLVTVPVGKPSRQKFVRISPSPKHYFETFIMDVEVSGEMKGVPHIVHPKMVEYIPDESLIVKKGLYLGVDRQGNPFIWPMRLDWNDWGGNQWNESALAAIETAKTKWVRVAPNMAIRSNDIFVAQGNLPEPELPEQTMEELLEIAFKGRIIDSPDHPALKQLQGLV